MEAQVLSFDELHARLSADLRDASLEELAYWASLSPFHFHREFVKRFGKTPLKVATASKMLRAQLLLRKTDMPVGEICLEVGYSSVGTFTERFRKYMGMTPTRYRESSRRPIPHCLAGSNANTIQ